MRKNPLVSRTTSAYVGNDRVLVRTSQGFKLFVDARDVSISPHIIIEGVWEEHVETVLKRIVRRGMHVIEIGANVGYFTVMLAHSVGSAGSVAAFEPDPILVQLVRDNLEVNGFHAVGSVAEVAVSDTVGRATFHARSRHRGNGSLVGGLEQVPWNAETSTEFSVTTTTLDAIVAERGAPPDVIKVDAEGAESAIMRGGPALLASRCPLRLIVEFIPEFIRVSGDDPASFLARLADAGFKIALIEERHRKIQRVSRDALLARRYSELLLVR